MYLFWCWMVRLVSFPCSSPKLGLAVRLVHSSNPHRTSLRGERGMKENVKSWHLLLNWGQEATAFHSLFSALNPSLTRGVRTTVSPLRALRIELFIAKSISRAWKKVVFLIKFCVAWNISGWNQPRTYCNPTEPCIVHLWSYSGHQNTDPEKDHQSYEGKTGKAVEDG